MTDTAREEGGPAGLSIYLRRPVIVVLLLGFSSGLPLALSGATLKVWLTEAGVTLGAVGLFGLVGLPYTLKFLWSPLIDRLPLPVLTRLLGRRRSWLMLSQICLMAALVALGLTNPAEDPWPTAVAALAVAFFSASQDIVIDAFRIESLSEHEQGAGAAVIQLGYRIAMLVSGGGALILADQIPWEMVYVAMAGLVLVGFLTALFSPEPSTPPLSKEGGPAQWIKDAVAGPFLDFAMRPGAFYILIFILLFPLGEAIAGAMSSPFYVDIGFSKTEIGVIAKGLGLGATIVGTLAGGLLVGRIGIARGLLVCGIAQTATTLMFVFLATVGPESWALAVTIAHGELHRRHGHRRLRRLSLLALLDRLHGDAVRAALLLHGGGADLPRLLRRLYRAVYGLGAVLPDRHGGGAAGPLPAALDHAPLSGRC